MKIAAKNSWKNIEMENYTKLKCSIEISKKEYNNLSKGLVPINMEDKWFIYFKSDLLHLHRSWTGLEILRLKITFKSNYFISEIYLAKGLHNFKKELNCLEDLKMFNYPLTKVIGREIF